MVSRIGVDVGGTFTDLVYFDARKGATVAGKVPTTPGAPEEGVLHAVREMVPGDVLRDAAYFLHGTTVGLNALLERRGAKVGLLCTAGLRDVLEIRRGDRGEMFNLFWRPPEPLVPRYLRRGVVERMRADGTVYRPLEPESVAAALEIFAAEGVESIAVCLINAWANPAHELEVMKLIADFGFAGDVSLSHRISREYREYERTSTTVIDAFVRGRVAGYLGRMQQSLATLGFHGQCLVTRSGGGAMSFEEAGERPFETIMSGPVSGAMGAAEIARLLAIDQMVTADIGGTSFDTTIILGGAPSVLYEGEIGGMPVQTPWVDVRSIGSGGGSIARVDAGGLLKVGPQSAGAEPGPAAYGRGGLEPTTTDAAAYLGMFGRGWFESGISLDAGKARAALEKVAPRIGRTVDEAAVGILRIAAAGMANAVREITVERGLDPRRMTLLPYGGAGPLLAVLIADELDIDHIVVPPIAGNFSAWGLLGTDLVRSAARTMLVPLASAGVTAASSALAALLDELDARGAWADTIATARLDLRYQGQEHWLSIDTPLDGRGLAEEAAAIGDRYRAEYRLRYGGVMNGPVEIVSVRAMQTVILPRHAVTATRTEPTTPARAETCRAYSFANAAMSEFALFDRDALRDPIAGPAIVAERTTSLYVDAGWRLKVGELRELVLTREDASRG